MNFNELLKTIDIELTEKQLEQFKSYYEFLIEYNKNVNLTAITEETEVYIKHFYDSILLSKVISLSEIETICDVGSGAGFPSIPLKILFPHIKVTIIDALDKRIKFLALLSDKLALDNVNLIHGRAEECAKELRESFDLVTARAVARENLLNELCIPLTKVNGYFVSMKGKNFIEEINEGKSLTELKGKIILQKEYILPQEDAKRVFIVIKHYDKCPLKYPRNFNIMKKKPL